MAVRLDRLTVKAQEALQAAYGIAADAGQQIIEPEHLLKALIDQADGIVRPILQKVGADPDAIEAEVTEAIARMPKVSGAGLQAGVGPRLNSVLELAFKAADKRKDAVRFERASPHRDGRRRGRRRHGPRARGRDRRRLDDARSTSCAAERA